MSLGPRIEPRRYWPLVVALLATSLVVGWVLVASLRQTGGHFVYALDDPYVHMAVARTLAQDGVWGVNSQGFTSAASSPLWIALLAGTYRLFGVHEITSLVLNLLTCALLLWLISAIASRAGMSAPSICVLLIAVALATPLCVLVMNGMEHVLQTVVDLGFVACAVTVLAEDRNDLRWARIGMWALAALVTATRYEGAFLVAIVAPLLLMRGRWRDTLIVGGLGALPLVAFGIFSIVHGGFFVPNSVLIKAQYLGGLEDLRSDGAVFKSALRVPRLLLSSPDLLVLFLASSMLLMAGLRFRERWTPRVLWPGIFTATMLIHLQFAATGFFRYEAYLVAIGLVAIAITTVPIHRAGTALVAIACLSPLLWRAYLATSTLPTAAANVYQQQYQMGLFVRDYYPAAAVALNDIGAVSFLANGRVLDLVGLADMETARARLSHRFDRQFMEERARQDDVEVAILYEGWFPDGLPPAWRNIGQWTIPNRVAVASDTVSFFSVNPAHANRLIASLRAFSPSLPRQVVERGLYTQTASVQ